MWYLSKQSIQLISWRILFKIMPVFLLKAYYNHLEKVMESDNGLSTNQRLRYAILNDILELGYPYFPWLKMHKGKY